MYHSLNFAYGTNKTVGEVYTYAVTVSLLSSQSHLMSIAVQRLIAVKYPFQCKRYLTQRRCIMVLAFIWLLSLNLPWVLRLINHAKISFSSSFICAPTLVLSYAYITFRMVRRKNIAATSSNSGGTVIWFSLAITLTFLICKLPAVVLYLTMNFSTEFFAVFCLYWLNSLFDPILYFLFNESRNYKCFFRRSNGSVELNLIGRRATEGQVQ